MLMKVMAFNGSPREEGNTATALKLVMEVLEKEGIETEFIQLGGSGIQPCKSCFYCFEKGEGFCSQKDVLNPWLEKIYQTQGILIGSPVYFGGVSGETKAFIDRVGLCSMGGGYKLRRKVGAGVIAVKRHGAVEVFNQINSLFALNQMVIPCSIYWNFGFGGEPGEIVKDEEGVETFRVLGENMAWVLKKLYG